MNLKSHKKGSRNLLQQSHRIEREEREREGKKVAKEKWNTISICTHMLGCYKTFSTFFFSKNVILLLPFHTTSILQSGSRSWRGKKKHTYTRGWENIRLREHKILGDLKDYYKVDLKFILIFILGVFRKEQLKDFKGAQH